VGIERALEFTEDVLPEGAEDAVDNDRCDLVVDVGRKRVEVTVERILWVRLADLAVGPARLGPASPLGLDESARYPKPQGLLQHLVGNRKHGCAVGHFEDVPDKRIRIVEVRCQV
jgi:hypothetical protein